MARQSSKAVTKPESPKAEKKIRKTKEKALNKAAKSPAKESTKRKKDAVAAPEKKTPIKSKRAKKNKQEEVQEKPEEIEVTIEYLSAKKEKPSQTKEDIPVKRSGRKPKDPSLKLSKPEKKAKNALEHYQGKDSISAVLEHSKAANFKDLFRLVQESYDVDSEARIKLDLAALERSGLVISTSSGYQIYKDIEIENVVLAKESTKKKPASEIKEVKTSKKKSPVKNTPSARKGRKPSNKKSAVKDKEKSVEEVQEGEKITLEISDEEKEEEIKDDDLDLIRPSSTKKSAKEALINLEQEDD